MWLFNVIKNGTLVDNQIYTVQDGILYNRRLDNPVKLNKRASGQWTYPYNNDQAVWHFINRLSTDVNDSLMERGADALVLFNDSEYEHNTDDALLRVSGINAANFTLTTGNLIGFIKQGDYSLKISSRFGDNFLRFIIADADGFLELENFGGQNIGEGYEWLLAYLWNIKFKRAYRLGLPKTYITKNEKLGRVRGKIDVVDYFNNKMLGKHLCSYREHSYENPSASLFLAAYEIIEHYSFCQHTRNIYNTFLIANKGIKRTRQEILRTQYFTNPFYNDYNVLIDLSKKIISQKSSDFSSDEASSSFLFDVSMLFEYFIRKLIKRAGIIVRSKYAQIHKISAGINTGYMRKLEPDLVLESAEGLYIFDVKYKTFDSRFGVGREDLFQLHTYIGQYANEAKIKGCGFIYPISEKRWASLHLDSTNGVISTNIKQHGVDIP
ncbi:5-methylcytosine restriction system specificity protein McrC, partial [Acinetobacter baumannii]